MKSSCAQHARLCQMQFRSLIKRLSLQRISRGGEGGATHLSMLVGFILVSLRVDNNAPPPSFVSFPFFGHPTFSFPTTFGHVCYNWMWVGVSLSPATWLFNDMPSHQSHGFLEFPLNHFPNPPFQLLFHQLVNVPEDRWLIFLLSDELK